MEYQFRQLDTTFTITIEKHDDGYTALIDGKQHKIDECRLQENLVVLRVDGVLHHVYYARGKESVHVAVNGEHYSFDSTKGSKTARRTAAENADSVCSPMPGLVVKIPVGVGERVTAGQTLAIVEAMKMQNELSSPRDGVVKKIYFGEGEQVDALQPIVDLEDVES
jgi:biotin carboxyl carrier protein